MIVMMSLCFMWIGDDLMRCVDLYNQAQSKWFEEMVTTSMVIISIILLLIIFYSLQFPCAKWHFMHIHNAVISEFS